MAWHHNQIVNYTYSYHGSQVAYAHVGALGWRRIKTGAADGVTNLFVIMNAAKANNRKVHVNIDAANLITHAYLV